MVERQDIIHQNITSNIHTKTVSCLIALMCLDNLLFQRDI